MARTFFTIGLPLLPKKSGKTCFVFDFENAFKRLRNFHAELPGPVEIVGFESVKGRYC